MKRLFHTLGWLAATALLTASAHAAPLVVATKSFTEQHILSALTVQYLQKKKAFRCSRRPISQR